MMTLPSEPLTVWALRFGGRGVANRTKNAVRMMCSRASTFLYERDRIIPVLKTRAPNMHSSTSLVSGQRLCVPSSTILMCFSYAKVICKLVRRLFKQDKRNIASIWQNSTIPLQGGSTAIAYHPDQKSSLQGNWRLFKSTACCACYPQRFAVPGVQLPLGFLQILGHRAVDVGSLEWVCITVVWWISVTRSMPPSPMPLTYILRHSCLTGVRILPGAVMLRSGRPQCLHL